jgi:hypothetical protein
MRLCSGALGYDSQGRINRAVRLKRRFTPGWLRSGGMPGNALGDGQPLQRAG